MCCWGFHVFIKHVFICVITDARGADVAAIATRHQHSAHRRMRLLSQLWIAWLRCIHAQAGVKPLLLLFLGHCVLCHAVRLLSAMQAADPASVTWCNAA
jgi:hypothetical protein